MEHNIFNMDDASNIQCKLKNKCPNKTDPNLCNCWDAACDGWMHVKCSELLLQKCEIGERERPGADELNAQGEPVVFCKKGCHSKWISSKKREAKAAAAAAKQKAVKKRKVPWEEDGSLDVLLEWLTTEGNYAEFCGANHNKGKSKTQHHKELALLSSSTLDCHALNLAIQHGSAKCVHNHHKPPT